MSGRIRTRPAADDDLIRAYAALADDDLDVADRFLDAAREAFETLARMPQMGSPRSFHAPELVEARMWRVPRFTRYLIFYRPVGDGIEILRVLHSSRDIPAILDEDEHSSDE